MKKVKFIALFLVLAMSFLLVACSKKEEKKEELEIKKGIMYDVTSFTVKDLENKIIEIIYNNAGTEAKLDVSYISNVDSYWSRKEENTLDGTMQMCLDEPNIIRFTKDLDRAIRIELNK